MTVFVVVWLVWNTFAPPEPAVRPRCLDFTLLTLILSLQASYAAPLILLAQNRQDDRDRVAFEQDRQRAERNLADTEYLTREVAALRIALREVATRDFVRSELRDVVEGLVEELTGELGVSGDREGSPTTVPGRVPSGNGTRSANEPPVRAATGPGGRSGLTAVPDRTCRGLNPRTLPAE